VPQVVKAAQKKLSRMGVQEKQPVIAKKVFDRLVQSSEAFRITNLDLWPGDDARAKARELSGELARG
jgi:hypothetical protein